MLKGNVQCLPLRFDVFYKYLIYLVAHISSSLNVIAKHIQTSHFLAIILLIVVKQLYRRHNILMASITFLYLLLTLLLQVIYIQALVVVVLMGKLMQKVFFGQLRAAEFEVTKLLLKSDVTNFSLCLLKLVLI